MAYVGDGRNNVANSLLATASILGVNIKIISPGSLQPDTEVQELAKKHHTGGTIEITANLDALKGVDAIYTDV